MSTPHPLKRPIKAHGQEVSVLTLREPLTKDIIELGLPTLIVVSDAGPGVEIRTKVVARYISRLADVPPSSVDALAPSDFNDLTAVVMGFFGQSDGEEQSAPPKP